MVADGGSAHSLAVGCNGIDPAVQCSGKGVQVSVHEGLQAQRLGSNADAGHPSHQAGRDAPGHPLELIV